MKEAICIDFDGVLNLYTQWNGEDFFPPIRPGVKDFLIDLARIYDIIIYTCRDPEKIKPWLSNLHLPFNNIIQKPRAIAYIDDRGINFSGDFEKVKKELERMQEMRKEAREKC